MSTAMNFGTKSFQPRPPDKGSFPLDHFGECKAFKEKFLKCLRDNNFENTLCRNESKEYLECRMERYLQIPSMFLNSSAYCLSAFIKLDK
uniref:Cytochrome c oxidase assembly protein COX19 n=1 Tax=Phascolarctos cinereus TaxID=38626 RepID=A0A6P5JJD3_PHACI|nr:cytochrome c oxidase assembly protein COX19 isoform X4 [Phascolarctos cinereus]